MSTRLRRQLRPTIAIAVLAMIATVVGVTVLDNQRVRFPFFEPAPYRIGAEFQTAQAVTPGQGQTVQVSGVRIGDIADVELRDGRAIVWMDIDPDVAEVIRVDATALLRPRTGLKDMYLDLSPGSDTAPRVPRNWVMPVGQAQPDVNLDEITQMLDTDTREYLQQLVGAGAQGLESRGDELREVLRRFEPTHRDLARVSGAVARRRASLTRLVRSLRTLTGELSGREGQLSEMVSSSARALDAFADQEQAVSRGVAGLPGALRETRRTLDALVGFSDELGPAARSLTPALARLPQAARAVTTLSEQSTPVLRRDVRPFTRAARPLIRDLAAPAEQLERAAAPATSTGVLLNRFFNMLGYNRDGREGPQDANRDEGFLFWLAWTTHNGLLIFTTADAGGPFRPLAQQGNCAAFAALAEGMGVGDPLLGTVLGGLEGVFSDPRVCGPSAEGSSAFARRLRGGRLQRTTSAGGSRR
ncbi:MlaD family protein [Paraconexibacter sp.]|uniref:MlaD family protein n=1 Tax=Paraconexibacter sp. TaxID=2949640 RepID=UPI003569A00A